MLAIPSRMDESRKIYPSFSDIYIANIEEIPITYESQFCRKSKLITNQVSEKMLNE